jgi:Na+/melibiose symporter-like transporter
VTDNTEESYRGKVEGVISVLPLVAMLIVAGGFGMLVEFIGYTGLFVGLGVLITACGAYGLFYVKDSPTLVKKGSLKDIVYGFKPSVVKGNPSLYVTLVIMAIYGVACQIFMPYLIIYMKTYLGFSTLEYSLVFGVAIVFGALLNLFLGAQSDKKDKTKLLYVATAIFFIGLLLMYMVDFEGKTATLLLFGVAGFIMITGYIFISALCGAIVRDNTPENDAGKLQGVRMIFYVLIPMLVGPLIGNAINKARALPLPDMSSADTMTTLYIPAPEIFLAGAMVSLLIFALIPALRKLNRAKKGVDNNAS